MPADGVGRTNGQLIKSWTKEKYDETLKNVVLSYMFTLLTTNHYNHVHQMLLINVQLNDKILNHCCKMESEMSKSITTLKWSEEDEDEDKKTTRCCTQSKIRFILVEQCKHKSGCSDCVLLKIFIVNCLNTRIGSNNMYLNRGEYACKEASH